MKYVFLIGFLVLVAMGTATVLTEPSLRSEVPVLYWVTDRNTARVQQVERFHEWLVEEGHVTADGEAVMELRLDTASRDPSKQIIQSVAGVAGDIMDCDIGQMHSLGVLKDVTEEAQRLGFGLDQTYAALSPLLTREGRQYGFPCNVGTMAMWSNPATFAAVGLEPPGREWTVESFETLGREFVKRANKPGQRQTVFFCNSLADWKGSRLVTSLHRARGLSVFNETMTASTVNDPRFVWVLGKLWQWTYEDHLVPTAAEASSFATQSGYGGAELPLFVQGQYAMILAARYSLIRMRDFPEPLAMKLSYFPTPEGGFANDLVSTRAAAVYKGSKHPDLAVLFLAYLASESYNQQIVADADALPPKPIYARSEAFLRPVDHPNEWDVHGPTLVSATQRAIAPSVSPFVADASLGRLTAAAIQKVLTTPQLASPEQAAAELESRLNDEIARTIQESTLLAEQYEELMERQRKIDAYRAQGRPVPKQWITNPFHRRYYAEMGWLVEDENSAPINTPGGGS